MKIAQVAPLYESVPPAAYGGTERVVSYLTEQLVRDGHDVTLFASGESTTAARLVSICPRPLWHDAAPWEAPAAHALLLESVAEHASEFDVIPFHTDSVHLPLARRLATPSLTTVHGRLDLPGLTALYHEFPDAPLASVSDAQREPLAGVTSWCGTVYHGLPRDLYHAGDGGGGYLAFLGRVSPEKRLDRAIAIARATGIPLRIAAKIDPADRAFDDERIAPLLDDPLVEFIGEVTDPEKQEFLGDALALVFPIDWPEPFGLVMIEALACGTPVLALKAGSVPEVLDHGVTGFVVEDMAAAMDATTRLPALDREACRSAFEARFTADRMAASYVARYERLRSNER